MAPSATGPDEALSAAEATTDMKSMARRLKNDLCMVWVLFCTDRYRANTVRGYGSSEVEHRLHLGELPAQTLALQCLRLIKCAVSRRLRGHRQRFLAGETVSPHLLGGYPLTEVAPF